MPTPVFGFSVGDFIACIKLAIEVYQACKQAGKATAEYQSVREELVAYLHVLEVIQDSPEVVTPEINSHISACQVAVQDFCTNSKEQWDFSSHPSAPSNSISLLPVCIKTAYRRTHWALSGAEAVDKFRQTDRPQIHNPWPFDQCTVKV